MKKKIIYSFLFVLCLLFIFSSTSLANGIKTYFSSGGKSNVDMETVTSNVYTILYTFGIILAVCILVTIAISYMVATPNKRAQLKERLIYYFAGVIFLVGGLAFLKGYEKVANDVGSIVSGHGTNYSYISDDGEIHYTDNSADIVATAARKTESDIEAMDLSELGTFVNNLDSAISEMKNKLNSGLIAETSRMQESIERAEKNLEFAKEHLAKRYENTAKDREINRKKSDQYVDELVGEDSSDVTQNY